MFGLAELNMENYKKLKLEMRPWLILTQFIEIIAIGEI